MYDMFFNKPFLKHGFLMYLSQKMFMKTNLLSKMTYFSFKELLIIQYCSLVGLCSWSILERLVIVK